MAVIRTLLFAFAFCLLPTAAWAQVEVPPPVSGRAGDALQLSDAMARARLLGAHLDRLRRHMGRAAPEPSILRVRRAAPREVIFAAGNLGRRVAELEFELLRRKTPWRFDPPAQVEARHLVDSVTRVLKVIMAIESHFGLEVELQEVAVEDGVLAADLMNVLIEMGALVDDLLEQPPTISEGFMYITFAGNLALDLHRVLTDEMMPEPPPLVPEQTVKEVFMKLIDCTERTRAVFDRLNVPVVEFEINEAVLDRVEIDTFSNLISILIAELLWLSKRVPGTRPPIDPYAVGSKLPSDLVQRAGLLEAVLQDIAEAEGLGPESIAR
ncbi:MAG: hypothetical protein AAGD10_15005 [Myxococcota bacterium]